MTSASFAEGVSIKNLGHSSLLIRGDGKSILLNPFRSVGCAEGLVEQKLNVDMIFASSNLPDEGARISKGLFFVEPGSYVVNGFNFDGFHVPHDRIEGRRYGYGTVWTWKQGGLKFAHLGGVASSLSFEDKILLGQPDVLIIGVGGGAKIYDGKEASLVVKDLNPKVVIPVQYVEGKPPSNCDQKGVQSFLNEMRQVQTKKVGKKLNLSIKQFDQMTIILMD